MNMNSRNTDNPQLLYIICEPCTLKKRAKGGGGGGGNTLSVDGLL